MSQYRKLIAAVVGVLVMLAHRHGMDLTGQEAAIADSIVAFLTAVGVYRLPNTKPNTKHK